LGRQALLISPLFKYKSVKLSIISHNVLCSQGYYTTRIAKQDNNTYLLYLKDALGFWKSLILSCCQVTREIDFVSRHSGALILGNANGEVSCSILINGIIYTLRSIEILNLLVRGAVPFPSAALGCRKLSVVKGTVLERDSILPSKISTCLYDADGAYCGITIYLQYTTRIFLTPADLL
jgi:hypothetical protein